MLSVGIDLFVTRSERLSPTCVYNFGKQHYEVYRNKFVRITKQNGTFYKKMPNAVHAAT